MVVKDCYNCKNRTEMSEAELYCADGWSSGDIFDWCKIYNMSVDEILERDPELKKCDHFEEVQE